MIQWFFIIKLLFIFLFIVSLYKTIKHKFKSKLWNFICIVFMILSVYNPIKLDVNTKKYTDNSNKIIKESKELPAKQENNSFEENNILQGITKSDIWEK